MLSIRARILRPHHDSTRCCGLDYIILRVLGPLEKERLRWVSFLTSRSEACLRFDSQLGVIQPLSELVFGNKHGGCSECRAISILALSGIKSMGLLVYSIIYGERVGSLCSADGVLADENPRDG